MILKGAEIFILGGSKDQTQQMREYIKGTSQHTKGIWWNYNRAPKHMIKNITAETVELHNDAKVTALAASEKSTRSKHGTDLYVDEADEIEWEVFTSALGQTYEGTRKINPLTFITSTWQNPDGTMSAIFDMADEKGWPVYEWCYRETHEKHGGHVTQKEINRKRGEMTDLDWHNEVELNRPESGDLVFAPEVIEFLFDDTLGEFEDRVGHEYVLIPPSEGESFYTGTDWAKVRDYTVIHTMIENPSGPDRLAAWCMRQKEPWPVMLNHMNQRVNLYGTPAMFDATGMAGDMIEDNVTVAAIGVDFSNRKLIHGMYSSLITACESGAYVFPAIPYLKRVFKRLTREQVYMPTTNSKNHTPDPFVAAALARQAHLVGHFELMLGRAG